MFRYYCLKFLVVYTTLCSTLLISYCGFAEERIRDTDPILVKNCVITPQIWSIAAPPIPVSSNDLRHLTGSPFFAEGTPILIQGKVIDEYCVPVASAMVVIWQRDSNGVFVFAKAEGDEGDINFAGSGSTYTDNLGNFTFSTIMPMPMGNESSKIYIKIKHKDMLPIETQMFFPNQHNNDPDLRSIPKRLRPLLIADNAGHATESTTIDSTKSNVYLFKIVLGGRVRYREY